MDASRDVDAPFCLFGLQPIPRFSLSDRVLCSQLPLFKFVNEIGILLFI